MAGIAAESELTGRTPGGGDRADLRFELATAADEPEIRRLLRENPMPGRISIALEREPDARLAAAAEGDEYHAIVARDDVSGRLIAMGSVSVRERFINRQAVRVGYLGQLRIDRAHRGRRAVILGGYARLRELHESLGVRLYLTSIAADNLPARRLLERGLPELPTYRQVGRFVTSVLPPQSRTAPSGEGLRFEWVDSSDLAEAILWLNGAARRHQFAPKWRDDALRAAIGSGELRLLTASRGGRMVGCIGLWDQSRYKQLVIRAYTPRLARWRWLINLAGQLTGAPQLPPVGTRLNLIYLSPLAVGDDDRQVFAALLREACRGTRDAHYVLGLDERHPLLPAISASFRRHTYTTMIYAVHWPDGRGAAEAIDDRPCHPEVALL